MLAWRKCKRRCPNKSYNPVSGNVFFAIFAAVGMVGLIGAATMTVMKGSVSTMQNVTKHTVAENDMIAASVMLSRYSLSRENADCDEDGIIEPVPFIEGVEAAPVGGGLLPLEIGATRQDPWKSLFGYCVWDHGSNPDNDGDRDGECGGEVNYLAGDNSEQNVVLAIVSAGPDRVFQTTCAAHPDYVTKTEGSDDLIRLVPYGNFLLPQVSQARLTDMPEEACTPETLGLMRSSLGVVQICADTGWTEVGTAATADANFIPVTNAILNNEYTSNEITFTGFLNKRTVIVTGGATLLIDGSVVSAPVDILAGQKISLRGTAPFAPETTATYSISVGGVQKQWTITTRDAYPPDLRISPTTANMTVQGPATPAFGAPEGFVITNMGERSTQALLPALLSNTTNFELYDSGSFNGDDCVTKPLAGGDSCVVDIRPKASTQGAYLGTLTVTDGVSLVKADLVINASGWTCPLPWGGTINDGESVVAYLSDNVTCGSSCSSQNRTCSGGVLSGSYTKESCDAAANCSYSWYTSSYGSCSASPYWGSWGSYGSCSRTCGGGTRSRSRSCLGSTGTQHRTVYCQRSDGQSVSSSYCSGGAPASSSSCSLSCSGSSSESQSCNTHSCCSGGGTCSPHTTGVCTGSCGGHYQGSTYCASKWTSTTCPSGCTKVMQGSYKFICQ